MSTVAWGTQHGEFVEANRSFGNLTGICASREASIFDRNFGVLQRLCTPETILVECAKILRIEIFVICMSMCSIVIQLAINQAKQLKAFDETLTDFVFAVQKIPED